jgi:hypothetical protein
MRARAGLPGLENAAEHCEKPMDAIGGQNKGVSLTQLQ